MKTSLFLSKILQVYNKPSNKLEKSISHLIKKNDFVPIKNFKAQIGKKLKNYLEKRQPTIPVVKRDFVSLIIKNVSYPKIILELGSRDGKQSIEFANLFPNAKIYTFECYPQNIKKCIRNTRHIKNIEIIPKAVYIKNGTIKFYPATHGNDGTGSLYRASRKYDEIEKISQTQIFVDAIRIDTWANEKKIKKIDLCWMDLQGAEYDALESMGNMISDVDAMFIELDLQEIYKGIKLYDDVLSFMKEKGFSMIKFHECVKDWYGNAVFLSNKLIK